MALEDYKDVVGAAAGICTVGQFFAGAFICKDIIKQGSTKNISVIPFLGGLVLGSLMMVYAQMLQDDTMIYVGFAGLGLNFAYFLCYYFYATDKNEVHLQSMQGVGFVMLMLAYVRWEDPEVIEFRYGLMMTAMMLLMVASPLFSLGEVIRTKSTATLPFPMIFSGTITSFLWLLYSIILNNTFLQVQNVVALVLSVIQLSLFIIYPNKPADKTKKQ